MQARLSILEIHSRDMPGVRSAAFMKQVAAKCVGFNGADLRFLTVQATKASIDRK